MIRSMQSTLKSFLRIKNYCRLPCNSFLPPKVANLTLYYVSLTSRHCYCYARHFGDVKIFEKTGFIKSFELFMRVKQLIRSASDHNFLRYCSHGSDRYLSISKDLSTFYNEMRDPELRMMDWSTPVPSMQYLSPQMIRTRTTE